MSPENKHDGTLETFVIIKNEIIIIPWRENIGWVLWLGSVHLGLALILLDLELYSILLRFLMLTKQRQQRASAAVIRQAKFAIGRYFCIFTRSEFIFRNVQRDLSLPTWEMRIRIVLKRSRRELYDFSKWKFSAKSSFRMLRFSTCFQVDCQQACSPLKMLSTRFPLTSRKAPNRLNEKSIISL